MSDRSKAQQKATRFQRISQMQGFASLVEGARDMLGLTTKHYEELCKDQVFEQKYWRAVATILRLCSLSEDGADFAFIKNAVGYGIEHALKVTRTPQINLIVVGISKSLNGAIKQAATKAHEKRIEEECQTKEQLESEEFAFLSSECFTESPDGWVAESAETAIQNRQFSVSLT